MHMAEWMGPTDVVMWCRRKCLVTGLWNAVVQGLCFGRRGGELETMVIVVIVVPIGTSTGTGRLW